ncbi:MAG: hypothetical protein ACKO8O_16340, partial [Betaproteobacteria bacterium]
MDSVTLDASALGLPEDLIRVEGKSLTVEMNQATGYRGGVENTQVLNLAKQGAVDRAIVVPTSLNGGTTKRLDYSDRSGEFMRVSLDAEMTVGEVVSLKGSFSVSGLGSRIVSLDNGSARLVQTTLLTAQNLDIEFGAGAGSEDFIGVSLKGADVGLLILDDEASEDSFLGLQATAESLALDGIRGLSLEASNLSMTLNLGPTSGASKGRVVDFTKGDIDGNGQQDGKTPLSVNDQSFALNARTTTVIVEGTATLEIRDPNAPDEDPALVTGQANVRVEQLGDQPLKIGATGLTAALDIMDQQIRVIDGDIALVSSDKGFALDLDASLSLPVPGVTGLLLFGDVSVALNRTGQALNETITVGNKTVSFNFPTGDDSPLFSIGALDASIDGVLGDGIRDLAKSMNRASEELRAAEPLPLIGRSLDDLMHLSDGLSMGQLTMDYLGQPKEAFGVKGVPTLR